MKIEFFKKQLFNKRAYLLKEAAARKCFVKKVFLEILQNSQENTGNEVSFTKRPQHWCFPVNFAKFLKTTIS